MSVPIDPPITVEAVPEKTYALWFFTNFKTENLHDQANATITFDKVPFDGASDYLWSHKETITRPFLGRSCWRDWSASRGECRVGHSARH